MEFLKRNGMGLAAILCCCVLGVLLTQQSGQLQGLRQENDALTTRLDAAESREKPIGWHGNGPVSSSRRMEPTTGH